MKDALKDISIQNRELANLKRRVPRKQTTPNFCRNKHFLPPNTQAYVWVSRKREEKFIFWKSWHTLFSCNTCFGFCPVALLPTNSKIVDAIKKSKRHLENTSKIIRETKIISFHSSQYSQDICICNIPT